MRRLKAVLPGALSVKTRKRQFPWQCLRELRGEPHLSGGLFRDPGIQLGLKGRRLIIAPTSAVCPFGQRRRGVTSMNICLSSLKEKKSFQVV